MSLGIVALTRRFAGVIGLSPVRLLVLSVFVVACAPQVSEQELFERARSALAQGDARAAEIDVKSALQQNPENSAARRLLAEVYVFQQNPVAAAEELERTLQAEENTDARILLAQALLAAGRAEELLELHEESAFDSVREQPRYQVLLARALAGGGELQRAREILAQAVQLAADDPSVNTTLAFFQLLYSNDPEAARQTLEGVLATNPDSLDALSLLAGIQQVTGELAEAEENYARVVELNPYRFGDRVNLVTVRIDQGKTELARNNLQALLRSNPNSPDANYLNGRMLVEAGENEQALNAFFNVLSMIPDHRGSLYLSAVANIGEGNLATALGQLERLLALQPDYVDGHLLLANVQLLMGDPGTAEEVARSILRDDESNYRAMGMLATALDAQGKGGQENIELYERMASVRPDLSEPRLALGAALIQAGDIDGGISHLAAARDIAPLTPQPRQALMQAYLLSGDIDAAKAEGLDYSEQLPRDPRPEIYLAQVALQENDMSTALAHFAEAETRLRNALGEQPDDLGLQSLLVDTLVGQGKLDDAGTLLAELPAELASNPSVLLARGRIELAAGRPAEAEPLLRRAMEGNPNSMTVLWLSGAMKSQGRGDEGIDLLNDWLNENPTDVLVRNELASTYLQLGREQDAREQYREVVERGPENVIVLNNLAWLLREENPEEALVHIERANELVPSSPQILDTYAMVQLERGALGEALVLNQQALDAMPGDASLRSHRAMILHADGQTDSAIEILESIIGADDLSEEQKEDARALLSELQGL